VKAMLVPKALMRASDPEHLFRAAATCPVVYFGAHEALFREDVIVPVFQKDPAGRRIVCYCFGIGEDDIRRERLETAGALPSERVRALVKEGRCACEVKNPQGVLPRSTPAMVGGSPQVKPRRNPSLVV